MAKLFSMIHFPQQNVGIMKAIYCDNVDKTQTRFKIYQGSIYMSYAKLRHTVWDCKYHIAFVPESRKKCFSVNNNQGWHQGQQKG